MQKQYAIITVYDIVLEIIGATVLTNLRSQREMISRNLRSLDQAEEELDRSERTINKMLRRLIELN